MGRRYQEHVCGPDPKIAGVLSSRFSELFERPAGAVELQLLSLSLAPGAQEKQEAKRQIFRITGAFQKDPHLANVTRFFVSGTYGRRTAMVYYQVDLIVFLSQEFPPYDGVGGPIDRMQNVLEELEEVENLCQPASGAPRLEFDFKGIFFRLCPAPSLGWSAEEQRQGGYRHMKKIFEEDGLDSLTAWHPALTERANQVMVEEGPEVHTFIRICKYWAYVHALPMGGYALEFLALLVGRQQIKQQSETQDPSITKPLVTHLDFLAAFRRLLDYCQHPERLLSLCDILSPASYISPWDANAAAPVLFDAVNPYENLLSGADLDAVADVAKTTLQRLNLRRPPTLAQLFAPHHVRIETDGWPAVLRGAVAALLVAVVTYLLLRMRS